MEKKITILHTGLITYHYLNYLFAKEIPSVKIHNIVDDSLLAETVTNGTVTPGVLNRLCRYYDIAASLGSDLIYNQCSAMGDAAEIAAQTVSIPVLRIDEAMAEKVAKMGPRIGIIATNTLAANPCRNIVKRKAEAIRNPVEFNIYVADQASHILSTEGKKEYLAYLLQYADQCAAECDAIVLAQGSLSVLLPKLAHIQKPVFSCLELSIDQAKKMLFS